MVGSCGSWWWKKNIQLPCQNSGSGTAVRRAQRTFIGGAQHHQLRAHRQHLHQVRQRRLLMPVVEAIPPGDVPPPAGALANHFAIPWCRSKIGNTPSPGDRMGHTAQRVHGLGTPLGMARGRSSRAAGGAGGHRRRPPPRSRTAGGRRGRRGPAPPRGPGVAAGGRLRCNNPPHPRGEGGALRCGEPAHSKHPSPLGGYWVLALAHLGNFS